MDGLVDFALDQLLTQLRLAPESEVAQAIESAVAQRVPRLAFMPPGRMPLLQSLPLPPPHVPHAPQPVVMPPGGMLGSMPPAPPHG